MNSFNINIEISNRQKNNDRGSSHSPCHLEFCHFIAVFSQRIKNTPRMEMSSGYLLFLFLFSFSIRYTGIPRLVRFTSSTKCEHSPI